MHKNPTDSSLHSATLHSIQNDPYSYKYITHKQMWNQNNFIYILTNKNNTVLYTGVTSNLKQRIYQHKTKHFSGFTKKYNINKLVYYERFDRIEDAIKREKQVKGWLRKRKEELINSINPNWNDLSENLD